MKYEYFVSYSYEKGFATIEISVDKEIETYDDVCILREAIKKKTGLDVSIAKIGRRIKKEI